LKVIKAIIIIVGILFDVRVSIHILRTHARRVS